MMMRDYLTGKVGKRTVVTIIANFIRMMIAVCNIMGMNRVRAMIVRCWRRMNARRKNRKNQNE